METQLDTAKILVIFDSCCKRLSTHEAKSGLRFWIVWDPDNRLGILALIFTYQTIEYQTIVSDPRHPKSGTPLASTTGRLCPILQ